MASERLTEGSVLGNRYKILEIVGRGGMGTVYRARDTRLDSTVAVKEMTERELPPDERVAAVRQFEREAKLLGQLSHPNLPRVTDYFVEDDRCYLVMEYVDGETLESMLQTEPGSPLPLEQVIEWGVELADTLAYLHSQTPPIVFRDLKPANVMISSDGTVRLIDFGIARRFQAGATKDTSLYGSPGYSPPEQYGRAQTDPRSDIYAFGATLHHLLTGRDPAPTPFKFPLARSLSAAVPPALSELIDHCVRMEEDGRVQTSQELRDSMIAIRSNYAAAAHRGLSGSARPVTSPHKASAASYPAPIKAVFAIVCLLLVAGGVYVLSGKARGRDRKPETTVSAGTGIGNTKSTSDQIGAATGRIQVTSAPPGADVSVDGRSVGVTPCEVKDIAVGKHNVKLTPPTDSGLAEWSREIEVHAGEAQILDAALSTSAAASQTAAGPAVTVQSVRLTRVAAHSQGQVSGIQITVSFSISGAQGKAGAVGAVFFAADHKTPLKPAVEGTEFQTSDGQLGVATSFQAASDQADYPNMVIFIPDSALPISADQVSWRIAVFIDGKSIYESPISALQIP